MKQAQYYIAIAIFSALIGTPACAPSFIAGRVSTATYQSYPTNATFFVITSDRITLTEKNIQNLIANEMEKIGFRRTTNVADADLAVIYSNSIGTGTSSVSGSVSSQPDFVWGGQKIQGSVSSSTEYPRYFFVGIIDRSKTTNPKDPVFIWQGEIYSSGQISNISLLSETFITELFKSYGENQTNKKFTTLIRAAGAPEYQKPLESELPTKPPQPSVAKPTPTPTQTKPTGRAGALCDQAHKSFKAGDYEKAVVAYKEAIRLQPDIAWVHVNLGYAFSELGRHQEAVVAYKEAIRLEPGEAMAYYNLGFTYRQLKRWQEAVETFKQALRFQSNFRNQEVMKVIKPDAYYSMGISYFALGRYHESVEALKQALRLAPSKDTQVGAHYLLGGAFIGLGDRSAALEEYKILKNLDPKSAKDLFDEIHK